MHNRRKKCSILTKNTTLPVGISRPVLGGFNEQALMCWWLSQDGCNKLPFRDYFNTFLHSCAPTENSRKILIHSNQLCETAREGLWNNRCPFLCKKVAKKRLVTAHFSNASLARPLVSKSSNTSALNREIPEWYTREKNMIRVATVSKLCAVKVMWHD